jgi:plastocyanin
VDYWEVFITVGYTYADGVTEVIWETDADGAAGLNECFKWDSDAGTPWTSMGANVGANITINYNLSTTITVISGTELTLAANATVSVTSAIVRHDEVTAIQAAHTAATVSGGYVFFPLGVYNVSGDMTFNADAPLWFDPAATLAIDSGVTVTFFNMFPPTHTVFSGSGSLVFGEQAITGVGDTILANAETVMLNPDGDYTMTSTPTIADGTPGQRVVVTAPNAETNTVTLQDQDLLAGTNLQLLSSTRDISGKAMLLLQFDGVDWIEMGPTGGMATASGGITIGSGTRHDGYVISDTAEVETLDDTPTTLDTIALLDENTYMFEAFVAAVRSDGTDRASWHIACTAYRTGAGSATLQGGVTILHGSESNAALDATFTVSGDNLLVTVTGIAAETWEFGSTTTSINMSN